MNKLFSLALITACMFVSIESSAGADGGPKDSRDTVRAYSKDHYITTFKGKELAQVSVVGDHSTDLDCQVFDN